MITRKRVEEVAQRHTVCPFELSLDTAAWADVVVCDYNYAFDPVVNLKRLTGPRFSRVGLLVDEAHQLGDRVHRSPKVSLLQVYGGNHSGHVPHDAGRVSVTC